MKRYSRLAGFVSLLFVLVVGLIPATEASEPDFVFGDKKLHKPVFVVTTEKDSMGPQGYHAVYRIFYFPSGDAVNGNTAPGNSSTLKLWTTNKSPAK